MLVTWFELPSRRWWTWMVSEIRCRNQIDYVTINWRFRNMITNTMRFSGADCGNYHVPVVVDRRIRLKNVKKKQTISENDSKVLKRDEI